MTDLIQRLKASVASRSHPAHDPMQFGASISDQDVDTLLALLEPPGPHNSLHERLSADPAPNVSNVVMTVAERDQVLQLLANAGPTQTVVRTLSDLAALVDGDRPGRAYPVSLYPGRVMEAVEADRAFADAVRRQFSPDFDDQAIAQWIGAAISAPSLATQIRQALGGKLSDNQISQAVQRALALTRIVDGAFPAVCAIDDTDAAGDKLNSELITLQSPMPDAWPRSRWQNNGDGTETIVFRHFDGSERFGCTTRTISRGCGPVTAAEEALDTDRLAYLFSDDCPEILWRALPVVDLDQGREIIDRVRNA